MWVWNELQNYSDEKIFLGYVLHKEYYKFLKTELSKYIQHGRTSTFKHCRKVAFSSYKFARILENRFNISVDYESLINAGYMHDFYLYDWHEKSKDHRLHGYTHPKVAVENAIKYGNANIKEQDIIKTHMWPLTITKIPKSREAWILNLCDKYSTILEVFNIVWNL